MHCSHELGLIAINYGAYLVSDRHFFFYLQLFATEGHSVVTYCTSSYCA